MDDETKAWLATLKANNHHCSSEWSSKAITRLLSIVERLEAENERLRAILLCGIPALETLYNSEQIKPYREHSPELKRAITEAVMGAREALGRKEGT